MKRALLLLALSVLSACATDSRDSMVLTSQQVPNSAPVAETNAPVTIAPIANGELKSDQPVIMGKPASTKEEGFLNGLGQVFTNLSGSLKNILSIDCSQDASGKP